MTDLEDVMSWDHGTLVREFTKLEQENEVLKAMLVPLKASAEWHHESDHSAEAIDNCRHPACIALCRLGDW